MSSKKRPYRIVNEDTGAVHMVLAISQAQAVSFVARNLFTVTAASGMDVANHAMNGGKIEDAGASTASGDDDEGDGDGDGDGDEEPDRIGHTARTDAELAEWEQHRAGGIAARVGITDND